MKLTKKLSCIAATVLALALLVCTAAVPAMAAGLTTSTGETSITGITVTDTITTDGNTYAPATSFEIQVTPGAGGTFYDGKSGYSYR